MGQWRRENGDNKAEGRVKEEAGEWGRERERGDKEKKREREGVINIRERKMM